MKTIAMNIQISGVRKRAISVEEINKIISFYSSLKMKGYMH